MSKHQNIVQLDYRENLFEVPPTRVCLVCNQKEKPSVKYVILDKPWLCDKCRSALLKLVESEDEG